MREADDLLWPVEIEERTYAMMVHFDPQLHPRNRRGEFRDVLNMLRSGRAAEISLPGGVRVTRSRLHGFEIQAPGEKHHVRDPGGVVTRALAAHDRHAPRLTALLRRSPGGSGLTSHATATTAERAAAADTLRDMGHEIHAQHVEQTGQVRANDLTDLDLDRFAHGMRKRGHYPVAGKFESELHHRNASDLLARNERARGALGVETGSQKKRRARGMSKADALVDQGIADDRAEALAILRDMGEPDAILWKRSPGGAPEGYEGWRWMVKPDVGERRTFGSWDEALTFAREQNVHQIHPVRPEGNLRSMPGVGKWRDATDATPRSKGHIGFAGPFEFFEGPNGDTYRVQHANPVMPDGYRAGGRFMTAGPRHRGEAEWQNARNFFHGEAGAAGVQSSLLRSPGGGFTQDAYARLHRFETAALGQPDLVSERMQGVDAADLSHALDAWEHPNPTDLMRETDDAHLARLTGHYLNAQAAGLAGRSLVYNTSTGRAEIMPPRHNEPEDSPRIAVTISPGDGSYLDLSPNWHDALGGAVKRARRAARERANAYYELLTR